MISLANLFSSNRENFLHLELASWAQWRRCQFCGPQSGAGRTEAAFSPSGPMRCWPWPRQRHRAAPQPVCSAACWPGRPRHGHTVVFCLQADSVVGALGEGGVDKLVPRMPGQPSGHGIWACRRRGCADLPLAVAADACGRCCPGLRSLCREGRGSPACCRCHRREKPKSRFFPSICISSRIADSQVRNLLTPEQFKRKAGAEKTKNTAPLGTPGSCVSDRKGCATSHAVSLSLCAPQCQRPGRHLLHPALRWLSL